MRLNCGAYDDLLLFVDISFDVLIEFLRVSVRGTIAKPDSLSFTSANSQRAAVLVPAA